VLAESVVDIAGMGTIRGADIQAAVSRAERDGGLDGRSVLSCGLWLTLCRGVMTRSERSGLLEDAI